MKEKGFTLIELLAVIVILAIIALIATPIILNIIDDAKKESDERSIELYASAIKHAVAKYQLKKPNTKIVEIDYTSETLEAIDGLNIKYDGSRVTCAKIDIYEDGTIYLANCKVNGKDVDYTYGKYEPITVYRWSEEAINISIGDTIEPAEFTTDSATLGKDYYLKHEVDKDNKVTESYACVVYNGEEYCVRGGNPNFYGYAANESGYTGNAKILKGLEKELGGGSCNFREGNSTCYDGSIRLTAYSDGGVRADGGNAECHVSGSGSSYCAS